MTEAGKFTGTFSVQRADCCTAIGHSLAQSVDEAIFEWMNPVTRATLDAGYAVRFFIHD